MTNSELIEKLCSWVETEIAPKFQLKEPTDEDDDTKFTFSRPSVFAYFVPPSSVNAEEPHAPSICVQFLETEESFKGSGQGDKTIKTRIGIVTWNPGEQVIFEPHEDESQLGNVAYTPNTEGYIRTLDGWKDLVNVQDEILRCLKATEWIEGMRVDLSSLKYGMFKDEQDSIYLYYPYWQGYIDFTVTTGATRLAPEIYDI